MKKLIIILISAILFLGCDKNENSDKGTISFGVNTHLINCIVTSKVYLDDKETGIIPGFCDTIIDCKSDNTLNLEIPTGQHSFKIEIVGQSGSCLREKTGDLILEKYECKRIFFDITKQDDE